MIFRNNSLAASFSALFVLCSSALNASKPTNYEDIQDKLFVVHASQSLPEDGYFKPGKKPYSDAQKAILDTLIKHEPTRDAKHEMNALGGFRPFISVAVGELVRPHSEFTWEHHPVAYITPWKDICDQVYSLEPADTCVLGGLTVTNGKRSLLIVDESLAASHKALLESIACPKVIFDPARMTLRQIVEENIRKLDGEVIALAGHVPGTTNSLALTAPSIPAFHEKSYWASYLNANPHVCWGAHAEQPLYHMDKYDYLFKQGLELPPMDDPLYLPPILFKIIQETSWWSLEQESLRIGHCPVFSEESKAAFFRHVDSFCKFAGQPPISTRVIASSFNRQWRDLKLVKLAQPFQASDFETCLLRSITLGNRMDPFLSRFNNLFKNVLGRMSRAELVEFLTTRYPLDNTENIKISNVIVMGYSLGKFIEITRQMSQPGYDVKGLETQQYLFAATMCNASQALPKETLDDCLFITYLVGSFENEQEDRKLLRKNVSQRTLKALNTAQLKALLRWTH